ncbi:uncharacterized protein Dwil_GK27254 [Drosophila willistoni]|uniref:MD-2-related lipid-recognition domain-containing protein n=1 Tax=Drosophila willistoni TaxID=7260 RepID=A0A0Q9WPS7_DROWI|nr:uncharacterized protein Dwil_GK27254 [Drosophila willistoni]
MSAFYIIISLLAFKIHKIEAISSMIIMSGEATFNPKYIENFTIYVRNHNLYVDSYNIRTLRPGFQTHMEFAARPSNASRYHTVFKFTINFCNALSATTLNIFKRWYLSMMKMGNFMLECPVKPMHYYIHGWSVDKVDKPSILPPGFYRVTIHFFYGKLNSKTEDFINRCVLEVYFR